MLNNDRDARSGKPIVERHRDVYKAGSAQTKFAVKCTGKASAVPSQNDADDLVAMGETDLRSLEGHLDGKSATPCFSLLGVVSVGKRHSPLAQHAAT